jgi:hypothetical protein
MKRIYVIWGGVLGWDGVLTSAGLAGLENKLRQYGPVRDYLQQSSYTCADDVSREYDSSNKVVLIGYSGGSVMATRICNSPLFDRFKIIDLLINIDGSPPGNMQRVGDNVRAIINIYDPNAWIFGGGLVARWRRKGGGVATAPSDTKITNYPIDIPHLAFQSNEQVHQIVVDAVRRL